MDWKMGPPVLVGERVVWPGNARNESRTGIVRWMGNIPEIGPDWCVGLELDDAMLDGGFDGYWKGRKLFECKPHQGLLIPINDIQKLPSRSNSVQTSTGSHSDVKLDGSQLRDLALSDLKTKSIKKNRETQRKHRFSALESKLTEWTLKNRTAHKTTDASAIEIKNKNQEDRSRKFEDILDRISAKQHLLKSKSGDGKLSLKKKRRKRKSFHELDSKRHSKAGEHSFSEELENQENLNESFENAPTLDSKAFLRLSKDMNDVAGYFKELKEDDGRYEKSQANRPLEGFLDYNMADSSSGHGKEKKFFSFLKWFKKNKDEPNIKFGKDSSAASSPMFARRRNSSCESVDTLFSTQTVKSFAYIPPNQYEPSAPPSSLLDFDKSSEENVFEKVTPPKSLPEETESIYDKRKKRKAPPPPRLSRENSLPTTLERKLNNDLNDGNKSCHRRTVSESFKDKKAGAYCHVQGKKKAPLPPSPPSLYPNLQKLNNQYPSLSKKKKPAPPPPTVKNGFDSQNSAKQAVDVKNSPMFGRNEKSSKFEPQGALELNSENEDKSQKITQSPVEKLTKDVSLSPLPSRPWYKRSHRDSNGSNIIKKDLLKGFEWKKNKETEDWMPEVGFPRRSLSTDTTHNKFNIFSRLEKNEDKKKEEKRKSQISILTNISELDREAAEIVRKEQAEEKKMMEENDAKYYSPGSSKALAKIDNSNAPTERPIMADPIKYDLPDKKKDERKESSNSPFTGEGFSDRGALPKVINSHTNSTVPEDNSKKIEQKNKDKPTEKENLSDQFNEKLKRNPQSPNVLNDVTNSDSPSSNKIKPNQSNLNFKVENKELNYLNEPWVCQKCTLENPGWRVFCEICSSVKPRFLFNPQKAQMEKPLEVNSKPEQKPMPEKSSPIKEPKLTPKESAMKEPKLTPKESPIKEPKHTPKESPTKETLEIKEEPIESLEELRKKRMTFFTNKLEGSIDQPKDEPEKLLDNSEKEKLKQILKDMKDTFPKPSPGKENRIEEKNYEAPNDAKLEEKLPQNKKSPPKKKMTVVQPAEEIKYGAIMKKQPPQPKKEEIAEAYIITKTTVLEDIIIKKGDKSSKASTSVQTTKPEPQPGTSGIKPPPRTKKNVEIAMEKASSSKKKSEGPLDLTPVEEKVLNYTQADLDELTNKLTQAEGLADFRANIETMAPNTEMNTVAVNRLLRRLETAINCGDHFVAAGLAKEIALMNINCSVTRQKANSPAASSNKITIDMYVEDKASHQGPIPIQVSPTMTLLQLKKKVHQKMGIPTDVQRWILGKKLATDDNKTLESDGVKTDSCAVFLYLVAPEKKPDPVVSHKPDFKVEPLEEVAAAPIRPKPPPGPGWYYNYEEDRYSYCEDSDDDSRNGSPEKQELRLQPGVMKTSQNEVKLLEDIKKPEKPPIVDLKTVEAENEVEKELKLISVNSVKQKVEQLNKTFAENSKPVRIIPRSSQSPESWRCVACTFVNSPGKFNCSACNAKKVAARFGLPVMAPPVKPKPFNKLNERTSVASNSSFHYKELIELQDADLVPNAEPFNCSICMTDYEPGEGVTLKDCLHTFCRTCLINTVEYSEDAEVKCPYLDEKYSCTSVLQQREIKALVPKGIFERHLAKSVKEAENKMGNAFHCKTPDCKGWCIYEDNVNEFQCPVCKFINCLTCQAIHTGINCREYQERMKEASETDEDAKKTREMLQEMVTKGEAISCPKCQVVLMKKWGCDWLRCSMCKTEICWVTRGFRWGPGGKGDTSGGCKCGVNGVKCHPKCNYCH